MNLAAVPLELQALPHWIIWRNEFQPETGRWTKIPYSPNTGRMASVTNPLDWSSWLSANAALAASGYDGLGYVITADDPFTFIDLDDPNGLNPDGSPKFVGEQLNAVLALQAEVWRRFGHTYSEISPSGKGLHLIVRGRMPTGKRRMSVEAYSDARYMTVTGNVRNPAPIAEAQADLDWLFTALGGVEVQQGFGFTGTQEDTEEDTTILERGYRAANGDLFADLYEGRWSDLYPSQSEADQSLVNLLCFYTMSAPQIKRLFLKSALGQRDKARSNAPRVRGLSYVDDMIKRGFDRTPPQIDLSEALDRIGAQFAPALDAPETAPQPSRVPEAPAGPNPYRKPVDGLLGQIAYFVYQASPRPVPEVALAAAIGLMAGITGRAYNVSGTGLNQYIMLLAGTGRGKEAVYTTRRLMSQVASIGPGGGGCPAALEFCGPDDIASGQALVKYMSKTSRSFITIQGEFDLTLKAFTSPHANSALQKLKQVLLKSYSRSGRGMVLEPTIYSESEKNTAAIVAPAFSLIGEGTPERFYGVLDDSMIADGLVPRFTIVHYDGDRVARNKNANLIEPPDALVRQMAALCGQSLMLNQSNQVIDVALSAEAEELLNTYDTKIDAIINRAHNDTIEQIWNRAHLKALKLAAVVAVGCNSNQPVITLQQAQWALDIVNYDTNRLVAKFAKGDVGMGESRQVNDLRRIMFRLINRRETKLDRTNIVARRDLQQRSNNVASFRNDRLGATFALDRTINEMIKGGAIQEVGPMDAATLGAARAAKLYKVLDLVWLGEANEEAGE